MSGAHQRRTKMANPLPESDRSLGVSLGGFGALLRTPAQFAPQLFLRELLRLAARSVAARCAAEPRHEGEIQVQLIESLLGGSLTLVVEDNGIGLTEDEAQHGLATAGGTCRAFAASGDDDLLSRLGLGLFTCFAVTDEVRVHTRAVGRGSPALEWVGRADGTSSLRRLDQAMPPGTTVYLQPRDDCRAAFDPAALRATAEEYGQFLPCSLLFSQAGEASTVHTEAPWSIDRAAPETWRQLQLATARRLLGREFLDAVPIRAAAGGVEGVVLVPAQPVTMLQRAANRVYRQGLLLDRQDGRLLPDWAHWLVGVVNVRDLRTNSTADGLSDDHALAAVRRALGRSLHAQFAEMAEVEPARWQRIVDVHLPLLKSLAIASDEFFRLFIDLLPFQSSSGRASLSSLSRQHLSVHYAPPRRHLAQLVDLAKTLGLGVVFARDEQEQALLEKASCRAGMAPLRELRVAELTGWLADVDEASRRELTPFLDFADQVLAPLGCAAELKHFGTPRTLALLIEPEPSRAEDWPIIPPLDPASTAYRQLWLNIDHPLVLELMRQNDPAAVVKAVRLIYAQAKLTCTGEVDRTGAQLLMDGLSESMDG